MRSLIFAPFLLLAPVPAFAHAILLQSDPPEHGTIAAGSDQVTLRFNSRIDRDRSRLTLQGTNAQMVLPLIGGSTPDVLSAKAELAPGAYVLHWQVLAIDGHMTRGDVHFNVVPK